MQSLKAKLVGNSMVIYLNRLIDHFLDAFAAFLSCVLAAVAVPVLGLILKSLESWINDSLLSFSGL